MPLSKCRRTAGSKISQGAWQHIHQLLIDLTGDAKRVEGTIGSDHSLKCSALALFQEFFTGDRSRLHDLGNLIQSITCIVRAVVFLLDSGHVYTAYNRVNGQIDFSKDKDLGLGFVRAHGDKW